jgi:HK97 family phage major capsid protein
MRDADVGLTDKEARNFSFLKVIRALVDPTDRRAQEAAAFEFEASRAAAAKRGKDSDKFVIPTDVLTRALNTSTTGTASGDTGGFGIATTLMAQSFIDILRNRATIMQLGTVMGGLQGNIDIPKQVAAAQGYWVGEDGDATESNLDLGQISLSPKTVAAFSEITRKLMVQSSLDVEALVRADLAKALALTIDKAGYYGTGTDAQPLGITNQTGINAVDFAAVQPTFAELVEMETQIALDNADVASMAYVGNAAFRGHAKTTLKFPGVNGSATIWEPGNTVNGYRTEITNQVNSGDVFMGNFADLLVAMWGGLELLVDPYSNSKKGRLRVVVFQDVDFALRRTQSFCLGKKPVI